MRTFRINQAQCFGNRRGVLLIVVLACVAIVSLLTAAMVRGSMDWRRQTRYESWRAQTQWLAESGLSKAASSLQKDPDYAGEMWKLGVANGLSQPATVQITVQTESKQRTIQVLATFAGESGQPITARRSIMISEQEKPDE